MIRQNILGKKPAVRAQCIVELRRIGMFRRIAIVQDQGPAPHGLGHMGKELPMGVHGTGEKASPMEAKENAIRNAAFGDGPHCLHSTRSRLDIIYTAWFGGEAAPPFPEVPGGG